MVSWPPCGLLYGSHGYTHSSVRKTRTGTLYRALYLCLQLGARTCDLGTLTYSCNSTAVQLCYRAVYGSLYDRDLATASTVRTATAVQDRHQRKNLIIIALYCHKYSCVCTVTSQSDRASSQFNLHGPRRTKKMHHHLFVQTLLVAPPAQRQRARPYP